MSHSPAEPDRLLLLIDAVCGGMATADELLELDALLLADEYARDCYLDYCQMHAALGMELRAQEAVERLCRRIDSPSSESSEISAVALPVTEKNAVYFPILGSVLHGTIGFFSQEVPFALLIATLITGLGLLAGSMVYVSRPNSFADRAKPVPTAVAVVKTPTAPKPIGHIAGMVDCRWGMDSRPSAPPFANNKTRIPMPKSPVFLGDRFSLSSGLLEIAYDSGAKVILQGPATYAVDSNVGGYLSVGKLTAKLEKKPSAVSRLPSGKVVSGQRSVVSETNLPSPASGRGAGGEGAQVSAISSQRSEKMADTPNPEIAKSQISDPSSPAPRPQSPAPVFAVRTPSATVTDLGTEFGVEVPDHGGTLVSVFEGVVECQSLVEGKLIDKPSRLIAGQAAQIIPGRVAVLSTGLPKTSFTRHLPRSKSSSVISLADLVAGGTGFGNWNNWGVNPLDGMALAKKFDDKLESNGKFQPYAGDPQIDGVFIPRGGDRSVQLDSAGHRFLLPKTRGVTYGPIWVSEFSKSQKIKTLRYPHRQLLLHANVGITFNLTAINSTAPGQCAVRFQSTAAYQPPAWFDPKLTADVWVFVDGQLRFSRLKLRNQDGPLDIDVPLKANDHFLTLVTTDGGDGGYFDHIQHHDPRLILEPISEGK